MIDPGYDPLQVRPQLVNGEVHHVTREYVSSLNLSEMEQAALMRELTGTSRCPPLMFFRATKEVLAILRLDPASRNARALPEDTASLDSCAPLNESARTKGSGRLKALLRGK